MRTTRSLSQRLPTGGSGPRRGWGPRTGKDGQDRFVNGLDFARVQDVAGEEGDDEQDDEDGQGPRGEDLLLARLGFVCMAALDTGSAATGREED